MGVEDMVVAFDHTVQIAAGGSAIGYTTRTAHSEALVVEATGYDVDHLDQPRAGLSLSEYIHMNALNNSCARMHL